MRRNALSISIAGNYNYPGIFQEIRKIMGEEVAAKLVEKFGGGPPKYIPLKVNPEHSLVELLGLESAQRLCDEFGGLNCPFPRNVSLIREKRNILIKKDYAAGMSQGKLAMKYQITTRYIREIVKKL
jgi:Mor family transcriptional regulator